MPAMARTPQDVTDAELAVLQALWYGGPATIRQLTDRLFPGGAGGPDGALQELAGGLGGEGWGGRRAPGGGRRVWGEGGREDLIGRRLRDVAAKLCGGSLTPLLTHLVRAHRLSVRERRELRELIDELDAGGKRPGAKA